MAEKRPSIKNVQIVWLRKKDQLRPAGTVQGPLNIWTEDSNCQIHSGGGLHNPYSFTDTQYFLDFFMIFFLLPIEFLAAPTVSL